MTNVLFGNLLAISHGQLLTFAGLLIFLALSIGFIYRPLLFASVNSQVAEAKGVPVRALSIIFMALLGLAVTMAVQAVGTLLLFALLVTPAATAIMLTPSPGVAMLISTLISIVSVWVGLGVSAMFDLPPSFVIVIIAGTAWFVVWLANQRVRRTARGPRPGSDHAEPATPSSQRPPPTLAAPSSPKVAAQ
jgi:zinc/manganese transport system permease protein